MNEAVRLIIWDLDETFWKGTLSEGGVELAPDICALVIELAKRGIVSTICSKNDFEQVRVTLQAHGVWEYFVMPSINWEPKGPRIRELIEDIQLRQPSVMFIDDNHLNLQEAKSFSPDIQVSGEGIIPDLLNHPSFRGKDDAELRRLNQYKLLERRKRDLKATTDNVEAFLRDSDIRVEVNYDVHANLDRALELVTRTNQLNYTKIELPSDPSEAREALSKKLDEHHVHAGLVRVMDRYGDHGYCGLYVTQHMQQHLLHFCFSCRILGMGVETWMYRKLGTPRLEIRGNVLNNVLEDRRTIDWIQFFDSKGNLAGLKKKSLGHLARLGARGGCDLEALIHYFQPHIQDIRAEFATSRGWFQIRRDHSIFLRHAIEGVDAKTLQIFGLLGYVPEDLKSAFLEPAEGTSLWLLSFIAEPTGGIYRHKASGLLVPFQAPGIGPDQDARGLTINDLVVQARNAKSAELLRVLREQFEFVGTISEDLFKENLTAILERTPSRTQVVLVLSSDKGFNRSKGSIFKYERGKDINTWMKDVGSAFSFVSFLDMPSLVENVSEMDGQFHFDRIVYFRAFKLLEQRLFAASVLF